jgi:sulfatase maturation enzyme AslB (radical SAM superfamily)
LIDPIHYKILHRLKDYGKNISLKYSTNCTILDYKKDNVLELWDYFKNITVMVSIDGINDIYNYIRQLSDYENVKNNIKKISKHQKVNHFGAAITLQVYNSFIIPKMCDEFVEECDMNIHMHRVNYPTFLDCRIIPPNVKNTIVQELSTYYDSIDSKTHLNWTDDRKSVTKRHIKDAMAMFNGGDLTKEIPNFVEFSDRLDEVQNVKYNWRTLLPMLAKAIDEN